MMRVIESFSLGKSPDAAKNEDRLIATDDFIAVIDGSTSKSGKKIDGRTGGVFAADFAAAYIKGMSRTSTASEAIAGLTAGLKRAIDETGLFAEGEELPTVVIAIYSVHADEIWRVGDIAFLLDGILSLNEKGLDTLMGTARAVFIELALQQGASLDGMTQNDAGRAFIMPLLSQQHRFANKSGDYGFGVINGSPVPPEFINVSDVSHASEIVMASDGYPDLLPSLAASEEKLAHVLANDPLLYKLHRATKGMQPGNVSFDDRTYIKFRR